MWQKIKNNSFDIALYLCLLTAVVLVGRLVTHHFSQTMETKYRSFISESEYKKENAEPAPYKKDERVDIVLSDEEISARISDILPKDFPGREIKIHLSEKSKMYFYTEIDRERLETYLKNSGVSISPEIGIAMSILPRTFDVKAVLDIQIDPDGGLLNITPESIEAAGVALSGDAIDGIFSSDIAKAVNDALCSSGLYFQKIEIKEGELRLFS